MPLKFFHISKIVLLQSLLRFSHRLFSDPGIIVIVSAAAATVRFLLFLFLNQVMAVTILSDLGSQIPPENIEC